MLGKSVDSDARFFELKGKFDLLLSENEQLKRKVADLGDHSLFLADNSFVKSKSPDYSLKFENDQLKAEIRTLISRNEELLRNQSLGGLNNPYNNNNNSSNNNINSSNNNNSNSNMQEYKIKGLQKLVEDNKIINEKNLKEITQLKTEREDLKSQIEQLKRSYESANRYNSNKLNETSFMLNRTVTYELEAENESLKHKFSSLELMLSDYKTKYALLISENDSLKRNSSSIKPLEDNKSYNEKILKEIIQLKMEKEDLRTELELFKHSNQYNPNKAETSFMMNRTVTYELEAENESLKHKLSSLELMLSDYKAKYNNLLSENESFKRNSDTSYNKMKTSSDNVETELLKSRLNTNEMLLNDYKSRLEKSQHQINQLMNENALLKAEIEELSKPKPFLQEVLNQSFREKSSNSLLNRTFQMELEQENESLKKNISSLETMLQDYQGNMYSSLEKAQNLEKQNNELIKENNELKSKRNTGDLINTSYNYEDKRQLEGVCNTNQRLMSENNRLMDMIRKYQDEMDGLKSRSRIDASFIGGDQDLMGLREKVAELQRENEMINNEKDKLLVELSKLMA